MNSMNELVSIAKEHGGIIETKTAAERGVSKNMLYKLCKKNKTIFMKTPSVILNTINIMLAEYKNNLYFSHQILENSMYNIIVNILRMLILQDLVL